MRSRKEMLDIIRSGQSVTVKGQVYSARNVDQLPSEAELAKGNPEAEAKTVSSLDEQIAKLQAERAKLDKAEEPKAEKPEAKKEASKAEAKADTKSEAKK